VVTQSVILRARQDSRVYILIDAPIRTVAAALAEPWLLRHCLAPLGIRIDTRSGQLATGDELAVRAFGVPVRLRVVRGDEDGLVVEAGRIRIETTIKATAAGTRLSGPRWVLDAVRRRAEQLASAPVVVGAVILDGDHVLAAQRDRPRALAGKWEFPGGKVERGEDERAALVRECREELAVDVEVGDRLGPDLILASGWVLRLYLATLAGGATPAAGEHRALRWVRADEIGDVDWLASDRVVLPALRRLLSR
jgi:8-oxo-dGTP diphosphatase